MWLNSVLLGLLRGGVDAVVHWMRRWLGLAHEVQEVDVCGNDAVAVTTVTVKMGGRRQEARGGVGM